MTLGAGLVLSGCGDDDTATTPAPAPPPPPPPAPEPEPEPEPPAPEAPATPTGLHVDTTETSIEWHWNAVEGAIGYMVQVSMDEMFDDNDPPIPTAETHYTVSDLEPGTTMYGRVRAAAGTLEAPLLSDWTTHVTGTSDVPAPTPPPPTPAVMVMFSLADDAKKSYFIVPDADDDKDTAMAWVNPEIMVESNSSAIITPMFLEDANGVSVDEGMNTPFAFVGAEDNWELLQSMVLSDGATFKVQRTTVGANQEVEPTGDVMYITCGPFECMEGDTVPELSIANSTVCTAWDPEVEIQVGKVDNDVVDATDAQTTADAENAWLEADDNDGVDLGIVTSSSLEMNVKHVFSGVAGGTNTDTTIKADKGSDKTLAMKAVASIYVDEETNDTDTANINEMDVCDNTYDAGDLTDEPEGCFRLRGPGAGRSDNNPSKGADYLSGWTIELSPVGGDVAWGRVDWDDDPFEDLTCGDADPIVVADHVDICGMFEEEVDLATGKGWDPTVVFESEVFGDTADNTDNTVVMWKASAKKGTGDSMFKTIWFDDNLDGAILKDTEDRPMVDDGTGTAAMASKFNDLLNDNGDPLNLNVIWEFLTDDDGDLTSGDLGKVDLVSSKDDRSTVDDERTILVESCASGSKYDPDETATTWDGTPCKTTAADGTVTGAARTSSSATATHPDGRADNYESTTFTLEVAGSFSEPTDRAANTTRNYTVLPNRDDVNKCDEGDGGDDDDNTLCDAEWTRDAEVTFADGTFGCSTTRMVSITCTWDADGGMAQGRNALPSSFTAGDKKFFLKCEAE